jgi:ankyrin repeat protein
LYISCYYGNLGIVQQLLEKGADVNAPGGDYGTALQAASAEGHDLVVQRLLEKGADVNAPGGRHHSTALQAASAGGHDQVVQRLLEAGADVNAQGGDYRAAGGSARCVFYKNGIKCALYCHSRSGECPHNATGSN